MKQILILTICILIGCSSFATTTPTKVMVRAKAKDAKFIGSSIGGAHVIIRKVSSGEILAEGITQGSTGNTTLIMKTPKERNMNLADENTAGFEATLELEEPTYVRVEVQAPTNQKQATVVASTELWVIPGKDILGDGIVVEIPGFVVDVLQPRTHQVLTLNNLSDSKVTIEANVVMMCGCPITQGGLWDANQMEVTAIIKKDGKQHIEVVLDWQDTNAFSSQWEVSSPGLYEVIVYAYNPQTGNTGVDKVNYIINE